MLFAIIMILIYIMIRFQWKFAVGSVAALVHDVISYRVLLGPADTVRSVGAGGDSGRYRLFAERHDRRIRSHSREFSADPQEGAESIMNTSVNQMLGRTVITSLTTLLVVLALFLLGGEAVRGFSIALIIGVLSGPTRRSTPRARPRWRWTSRPRTWCRRRSTKNPSTTCRRCAAVLRHSLFRCADKQMSLQVRQQQFPQCVVHFRRAGDDVAALEVVAVAVKFADQAAGFAHEQRAGSDVPGVQTEFPEAVVAAGREPGQVERRGARAPHAGGLLSTLASIAT